MKNKTKFILIACAIIVYIVALTVFHFDYAYDDGYVSGYVKYGMYGESSIIIVSTIVYLLIIGVIVGIMNHIKNAKNVKITAENASDVALLIEPIEEAQTSISPQPNKSSVVDDADTQYIGTGIIGLKNYTDFCQIAAILAIFSGILCIVYAIANSDFRSIFIMLAMYLIFGGIGCLILSALLKAIITITKAAKLYLDINKKEEE